MRATPNIPALAVLAALAAFRPASAEPFEAIKGESTLSYHLVHPMHKVNGVSRDFVCQVDLSPDTVSSHIRVSAAIASFDSRNSSRDSHAMEIVQALKYPRVEFASDSVKPDGDGYLVSGKLTFHGRTRPIAFRVTPHFPPGKVEITGGFKVKLSDFDVKRPSLLLIPVKDEMTIDFDLFALP
jgi:polyisoprenoid-binding protein YceI